MIYNIALMVSTFIALVVYLVYFIDNYHHPNDNKFGRLFVAKVIIFVGWFLGYAL